MPRLWVPVRHAQGQHGDSSVGPTLGERRGVAPLNENQDAKIGDAHPPAAAGEVEPHPPAPGPPRFERSRCSGAQPLEVTTDGNVGRFESCNRRVHRSPSKRCPPRRVGSSSAGAGVEGAPGTSEKSPVAHRSWSGTTGCCVGTGSASAGTASKSNPLPTSRGPARPFESDSARTSPSRLRSPKIGKT